MQRKTPSRLILLLPLLGALCGLALLVYEPVALQGLRNGLFDQYQRWYPRPDLAPPVRIIDIDETSLARLGQWPWPRTRLAELVDRLNEAGAAAIGFDIVFAEADRTSPAAVAQLWPLSAELKKSLTALPDHDQVFAHSIKRAPVVLAFAMDRLRKVIPADEQPARPYRIILSGNEPGFRVHEFTGATRALPVLEQAASGNGAMTFVADTDGVVRRVPLALRLGGEVLATLTTEVLRVGQNARNLILKAASGERTGLAGMRIGAAEVPTTATGELWVHYALPRPDRYIPAWKVLSGELPRESLDGHLVLIGTSAPGLMDLRFSALGQIIPGVEIHAQALEQILSNQWLQRPAWAKAGEAVFLLVSTLLIGFLALRTRALLAALVGALILGATLAGGWIAFREFGLLLDVLTPALVISATFVVCSLAHHLASEREQRWIKDAFSRYVSPNRVAHLIENPSDILLGGHRQVCSFVFTDLAGFTTLMEKTDASDAVSLLNNYIDEMIAIAFRHDGTLDRIVGDAVAIMFSAPVEQADHAARALACALEMDRFACAYAATLRARGIEFGLTRIGIHSGEVIVGNFGGSTMFDYRALGDTVNTASRLEGANRHLGTRLCLSGETLRLCPPDTPARPVGRLVLKGKTQALQVFEPLSGNPESDKAPLQDYLDAYALLAAENLPAAATAFLALSQRFPDDALVTLHATRLAQGAQGVRGDLIVLTDK